jgi:hypothetical protein
MMSQCIDVMSHMSILIMVRTSTLPVPGGTKSKDKKKENGGGKD